MTPWIIAVVAVAMAAYFAGMWQGERGRRKDLAWLVQRQVPEVGDDVAVIKAVPDAEALAEEILTQQDREVLIQRLMDDTGCSLSAAEEDVDRQLAQLARQSHDGW